MTRNSHQQLQRQSSLVEVFLWFLQLLKNHRSSFYQLSHDNDELVLEP